MGQKVNPIGFRIGKFYPWKSRWFADRGKYKDYLVEDIKIRRVLMDRLKTAGVTMVEIERLPKSMKVIMTVSRPGVVIGRGGTGLEDLKRIVLDILREIRKSDVKDIKIDLKVNEVRDPEISAQLVASRIVMDLERRMKHRAVLNRAMERVMQSGALGIKIVLSGRIGGVDIARVEKYHKGSVPTQTLRANIDYAQVPALLKKGYVGLKVYIHKKKEE
uniref:30S ribosomal protein S3 n=1 Tax=uncultured organism TaxID=155900 RepID=U3GQM4_9ZZZZ|nr:30S ribosomal protein S3 [uncultured organism]